MTEDLEAMMAKALAGQFFWEPTTFACYGAGELSDDIRKAQRKFVDRPKKTYGEKTKLERERIDAILRKKAEVADFVRKDLFSEIRFIRDFIADLHKVGSHEIAGEGRMKKVVIARHHFIWSLVRYYPDISIAELGRQIEKHHTTILHSRNYFNKVESSYSEIVAAVDNFMKTNSRFSSVGQSA